MDKNYLFDEIKEIYDCLGDELSRRIFCDRLLYSLTGDVKNIFRIVQYMPKMKAIIEKLNDVDASMPKYIYGAGIRGRAIKKIWPYDWKGFIDQNEKLSGAKIDGLPVISCKEVKDRGDMVIIIPNRFFADDIYENLICLGVKKEHIFNISELWNELLYEQYFDLPELTHSENEVFVDDGAFDGVSTMQFLKWSDNNFKRVYIWEPDQSNLQVCVNNLENIIPKDKMIFVNKASWSTKGSVSFSREGVLAGVDENGERMIKSSTVSQELQGYDIPTFIKMDIEGAESQTLAGCRELIRKYCPKLAISVYHRSEDIVDLLKLILSFNRNYKFYLRHYSCADWDTVLYAVPQ